jgi:MYXO-CTERM domain-containing protein
MAVLPEGQVLLAGGSDSMGANTAVGLFDETVPVFGATGAPTAGEPSCTAQLSDGRLLRIGPGLAAGAMVTEVFDGVSTWHQLTAPNLFRTDCTAALLHDGKVLVAGGADSTGTAIDSSEIYDPAADSWTTGPHLAVARKHSRSAILPTGEVMFAGGLANGASIASTELYEPATGKFTDGGTMTAGRYGHTLTLLWDGQLLVTGGITAAAASKSTETWSIAQRSWQAGPSMATARTSHTATLLSDRSVVVVGGAGETNASIERLSPFAAGWASMAPSGYKRDGHVAARLPFNRLLLVSTGEPIERLDFVDSTGNATLGGAGTPDTELAATLPTGQVLLVGNGTSAIYDERVPARPDAPRFNVFAGPVLAPSPTEADGTGFAPLFGADDGTTSASPGGFPIALFRHVASGLVRVPITGSYDNTSVVLSVTADYQPGWYAGTITVNGVASNPITFFIAATCTTNAQCLGGSCSTADQVCCPTPCAGNCSSGTCVVIDGGMLDGGMMEDAGTPDSGMPDAGTPDAGMPDAGTPDSGMPDSGTPDAGQPDAGGMDAGTDGGFGPRLERTVGCGCESGGTGSLAWIGLLLLFAGRRPKRS